MISSSKPKITLITKIEMWKRTKARKTHGTRGTRSKEDRYKDVNRGIRVVFLPYFAKHFEG